MSDSQLPSYDVNQVQNQHRILLVEDDKRLAALVQEYLQQQGLVVAIEYRGDRAVERIMEERPDLVVLDLMLPGKDGFEVCKEVRPGYTGSILMLTARDEDIDQVVGLEIGADDYVTKPVQPRVLLARIRVLLRRLAKPQNANGAAWRCEPHGCRELRFGQLHINAATREVRVHGELVDFTTTEFELLWLLAGRAGKILSRDDILEALRGISYDGVDRSVDLRFSRLRKKLGDDPVRPTRIKTVRGKGYLFVSESWA
jgi:two-component system OmpR family response regulator/two-component system response regulator RstA